jgi:terminase, large subunit
MKTAPTVTDSDGQVVAIDQVEWLARQFESLTSEYEVETPSHWAESCRYLGPAVTALPGFYRFEVAPYLREIVDCFGVDNPIREVVVQKGVQIGATVGVLENIIGYFISHVRTAPMMMVTADSELAKGRMESNITPMLQMSGLDSLIKSTDETNTRKTGKTDRKIEWLGGGYLIPFGAKNANKLRSVSIQVLLRDEIDGWLDVVGSDGDPVKLSADRTAAYESSRKILDISTPLIRGRSKIEKRFLLGDQRYYYVCCLKCGFPQVLRWRRTDGDGVVTGISWETEGGRLVPGSVRYLCQSCGHAHTNDDKTRLLDPKHGAEWRPSAIPSSPFVRSYHLSALYSPVGMQTWEACVSKWLEAWDVEAGRPRDMGQLQVFYNNVLGETFELRGGEKIRFEMVSAHRRHDYSFGEVPNRFAAQHCGGPALLLVCTVDVHKDNLAVGVFAWCREKRVFLVDYWRFGENPEKPGQYIGDTENLDDPHTWVRLRKLIEEREYIADDAKRYRISITLIDSGYRADDVYRFAAEYASGVYPVKGRDTPPKSAKFVEFSEFTTPMGTMGYGITVDIYKERWSPALRRSWDGVEQQSDLAFNAPLNVTDKQLKELTAEVKRERIDPRTKQRIGWEWHRTSGAANELFDLLVYANAAFDMLAWDVCRRQLLLDQVEWNRFYELCEKQKLFYTTG